MAQDEAARIGVCWAADGVHKWMAYDRLSGGLVGRGGLSRTRLAGRDYLEVGWALLHQFWGHGYATEIGQAAITFAFDELDAAEIVSFTEVRNTRSRAVMERLGFQLVREYVPENGSEPFALYALSRSGVNEPTDKPDNG